jgi:hypothetical protein
MARSQQVVFYDDSQSRGGRLFPCHVVSARAFHSFENSRLIGHIGGTEGVCLRLSFREPGGVPENCQPVERTRPDSTPSSMATILASRWPLWSPCDFFPFPGILCAFHEDRSLSDAELSLTRENSSFHDVCEIRVFSRQQRIESYLVIQVAIEGLSIFSHRQIAA